MIGQVVVEQLAKTYHIRRRHGLFRSQEQDVAALKAISMIIEPGQIYGLLGPNGAGKTTLIKILTTLLLPSSGRALINGYELGRDDNAIRATVGCMLMGERGLYWKLTGRENLRFFGALFHLAPRLVEKRLNVIIDQLDLGDIADRLVETYSSGQRMKLAFGKSLLNDAPILVLDEPTNTLDVPTAHALRATVRRLNEAGKTVIYTTHILTEAETLCDRVAIIDHGEIIAEGTVPELKASLEREEIIRLDGIISHDATAAVRLLNGVERVALSTVNGHNQLTVVVASDGLSLGHLISTLNEHGATLQRIAPEETTLEDVFIARTGRTLAEDTRLLVETSS